MDMIFCSISILASGMGDLTTSERVSRRFSPEALSFQFTRGLAGWFVQVVVLKGLVHSLGSGEAPLLDIVAYGGYAFKGLSLAILMRPLSSCSYYFLLPWMSFCMGVFLVKIMKRVLFTEMRSYEKQSSRQQYLLLIMAIGAVTFVYLACQYQGMMAACSSTTCFSQL